jgi:hypothetical protein
MKSILRVFFCGVLCTSAGAVSFAPPASLEDVRTRALAYFVDGAHPKTGLVRDRAHNGGSAKGPMSYDVGSIASTGIGLAVIAHAGKTGRLPKATAYAQIEKTLRFVSTMPHYKGWLYHYLHMDTGERWGLCEASTIDTALFIAGALYAGQVFPSTDVATLAQNLFDRMDFQDMLTNGGAKPTKITISHGWTPESGYLPWQWDSYAEHMMLVLLGMGHTKDPLPPAVWDAVGRPFKAPKFSSNSLLGLDLPLFIHQYSHLFVDFRSRTDRFTNYFENSRAATQESRTGSLSDKNRATYREGFWGLSAGDTPTGGYDAYSPAHEDGTICPGCAGASAMFDPPTILGDLNTWMKSRYIGKFWGKYGFSDSINIDQNWFDPDVIGITVGALYLGLVNVPGEVPVWQDFMKIPAIQRGMDQVFPAPALATR